MRATFACVLQLGARLRLAARGAQIKLPLRIAALLRQDHIETVVGDRHALVVDTRIFKDAL